MSAQPQPRPVLVPPAKPRSSRRRFYVILAVASALAIAAWIGERFRSYPSWQAALAFLSLGAIMCGIQLATFPASAHCELPWRASRNGWEQAFVWIRKNTPHGALFALDSQYIVYPGEDAQYFSAIAERSALPDYSKDGGLASISPRLAQQWVLGVRAQTGLNRATDSDRIAAPRPYAVGWIVLPAASVTALPCPFSNAAGKVCRIDDAPLQITALGPQQNASNEQIKERIP